MKQLIPFAVSGFTNPSGKIVFQLYARIHGQRFRKNYLPMSNASGLATAVFERTTQAIL